MSGKSVKLATFLGTSFSITFKPMHIISQNFASNIHVLYTYIIPLFLCLKDPSHSLKSIFYASFLLNRPYTSQQKGHTIHHIYHVHEQVLSHTEVIP